VKRLVETIHTSGQRLGRLFSRRLAMTIEMHEFEDEFFTVLGKVQDTTNFFDDDVLQLEAGELVSDGQYLNKFPGAKQWYTPPSNPFQQQ
jgi:hypothetical protein